MGFLNNLFGNKKENHLSDPNYIETIVSKGEGQPLGVSMNNVIYAGYNELGGYYYLQTYIMGAFKLKTKTGAKLFIDGDGYTFDLNSDMTVLESENSPFFKGYVTQIDFEIDKKSIEKIKRETVKKLTLSTKKENIEFLPYVGEQSNSQD